MPYAVTRNKLCLLITALCAAGLPSTSRADATAIANANSSADSQAPQNPQVQGAVDATSRATSASGGSAYAYANLNTGVLRDVGVSGPVGNGVTEALASSSINDTLSFTNGFGMTAYLDYRFDGTLGVVAAEYDSAAIAQLYVFVATVADATTRYETLSAFSANCGPNCEVGTSTARTGTIAFTIMEGPTSFQMSLYGEATNGNSFDFGNTARFYLRLPDGASYSSASGNFLAAAAPVLSVPEPASWAMLLLGGGVLLRAARARAARRA